MKKYIYFFTRQDISPEQQVVQTAHVAFEHGAVVDDTNNIHFVVVGVRNLEALDAAIQILDAFGIPFSEFREPYLKNELTSVATWPIKEAALNLLKFG